MYSDLDKKAQGGYIIKDALVMAEIFSTAVNLKRGQIFYGRGFGYDFERYLLRLNEPDTILSIQSDLYKLRNLDGRLIVDPNEVELYTDTDNPRVLMIQASLDIQGLPWINAESLVEDNDEDVIKLSIKDFVSIRKNPWISVDDNGNELEGNE